MGHVGSWVAVYCGVTGALMLVRGGGRGASAAVERVDFGTGEGAGTPVAGNAAAGREIQSVHDSARVSVFFAWETGIIPFFTAVRWN